MELLFLISNIIFMPLPPPHSVTYNFGYNSVIRAFIKIVDQKGGNVLAGIYKQTCPFELSTLARETAFEPETFKKNGGNSLPFLIHPQYAELTAGADQAVKDIEKIIQGKVQTKNNSTTNHRNGVCPKF
jgi:hypothetical protein